MIKQPGSSRPDQPTAVAGPQATASEHGYLPELPAVLRSVQVDRLLDGGLKLRHFVLVSAIERNHSVVHAADELHVRQPAVTRALRDLESNLGVELFECGPRGMTATVFGIAFLQHAEAILGEVHQLGRHLTDLMAGQVGTVSVGTYLAGSNILLPHAISPFKVGHPMVTVEVIEQTSNVLVQSLLSGAMDLIVSRLTPTGVGDRLTQIGLYTEPVRLVVRVGHPTAGDPAPDIEALLGYPWILPQQRTALRREVEQAFLALGLSLPADRGNPRPQRAHLAGALRADVTWRDIVVLSLASAHASACMGVRATDSQPERTAAILLAGLRADDGAPRLPGDPPTDLLA